MAPYVYVYTIVKQTLGAEIEPNLPPLTGHARNFHPSLAMPPRWGLCLDCRRSFFDPSHLALQQGLTGVWVPRPPSHLGRFDERIILASALKRRAFGRCATRR